MARRCAAARAVSKTAASEANGLGSTPRRAANFLYMEDFMKELRVKITHEENAEVERLYLELNNYYSILGYMSKYGSLDTNIFDKKWEEAIELGIKLDKLKEQLNRKYYPVENSMEYKDYYFDFINEELVYKT